MKAKIDLEFSWEGADATVVPEAHEERLMEAAMRQIGYQVMQGSASGALVDSFRADKGKAKSLVKYKGTWALVSADIET